MATPDPDEHRSDVPAAGQARGATDAARPARTMTRLLVGLAIAGLGARILLACVSAGTNDLGFYTSFSRYVVERGLRAALNDVPEFNLTPMMTAYSVGVLRLSEATGIWFALLFKLPLIAADAASMLLLWKLWRRRSEACGAAAAAALFAWSLDSILVSGFHCNTDPFYAFLALLAAYLAEDRARPFAAGVALAAAVNVKLIPVVLAPALLAGCRTRGEFLRLLGGVSLGAIPFVVMLLVYGGAFYEQVIDYNSRLGKWGVGFFLRQGLEIPATAEVADLLIRRYRAWGKYLMLLVIGIAALDGRRLGWDRYRSAAIGFALFLILTPGFGVQYTVGVVPLLFAVSVPFGVAYSCAAGAYLLALYVRFGTDGFPLASVFTGKEPLGPAMIGLVAWGVLIAFVVRHWRISRGPRMAAHAIPSSV